MHRLLASVSLLLLLTACRSYVQNPDPNHTHADFAVWVNGEQFDFSTDELMSGAPVDDETAEHDHAYLHQHLHLHDNIGTVLHRHKPGLTLEEFFHSLEVGFDAYCYTSFAPLADGQICGDTPFRMFVGNEAGEMQRSETPFDMQYVFNDMDSILITNAATDAEVDTQWAAMTFDACKYSRTCPWKGEPPAENCVADPAVPCVVPLEDL